MDFYTRRRQAILWVNNVLGAPIKLRAEAEAHELEVLPRPNCGAAQRPMVPILVAAVLLDWPCPSAVAVGLALAPLPPREPLAASWVMPGIGEPAHLYQAVSSPLLQPRP